MQEHSWLKELGTLGIKQQAHSGLRSSLLAQENHHEAIPCSNRSESKHLGTHGGERRKSIWQLPFLLLSLGHLKYTAMTENSAQSLAQCPRLWKPNRIKVVPTESPLKRCHRWRPHLAQPPLPTAGSTHCSSTRSHRTSLPQQPPMHLCQAVSKGKAASRFELFVPLTGLHCQQVQNEQK